MPPTTQEINSRFIKLSGKAEIPESLELEHNYKITIDATVTSISEMGNNNGTKDISYKVEPILCEILKDNGEVVKAKDTRSESSKTRRVIYAIWSQNDNPQPFEEF